MARNPETAISPSARLYLLGAFRLERDGRLVGLPTRKVESLLAFLALYREAHAREKLAARFWGDSPDQQARDSLRTALKTLRKQLGDDVLLADRETVQLNPAFSLWIDVREFEQTANDSLEAAINLYRSDLLAGLYDEWILPERERLRDSYLNTLLRLAHDARMRGDCPQAIEVAKRVLALDAANERAHQHLMFCYHASGDRTAALKQYEACVRALRDELDVTPSPETTVLYLEIKRAAPQPEATAPRRTNVPAPLNSFIGRTREMDRVKELIASQRLVTLTGAGGSGKTRLAIHVSTDLLDRFDDGVWWVELAVLMDASLVPQAIAKVLNVREVPNQLLGETLVNYLRAKQLLLVLDNCEHLIDACAQLVEIHLRACPNLKILATSREALDILGESVYQVPTLSLPTTLDLPMHQVLEYEATRLFVERASAVNAEFAMTAQKARAVAQICQRLDGIPLAIELAAARAKLLTPEHIAARLDDRFNLLTHGSRGALPRHQTLRATIDWSYDLLPDDAKKLFRRLSVFVGGFTLDAAEVVCTDEQFPANAVLNELARLVDRSLVLFEQRDERERYRLLETIRDYAREKLEEAGETEQVRDRHLAYFVGLAEKAEANTFGAESWGYTMRLNQELDNIRAAMDWTIQTRQSTTALRLAAAMTNFWPVGLNDIGYLSNSVREWQALMSQALSLPEGMNRTTQRAKALNASALFYWADISRVSPQREIEEALSIGRELEDNSIIATSLCNLGLIETIQGNYAQARSLLQEGLDLLPESGPENKTEYIYALIFLGDVALNQDDLIEAQMFYEQCYSILRNIHDRNWIAYVVRRLGQVAWHRGELEKASEMCQESLKVNLALGHERGVIACLPAFAGIAMSRGKARVAAQLFGAVPALLNARTVRMLQIDQLEYNRNVSRLRAQLDSPTLEKAWAKGAEMTLEQAVEYALETAKSVEH
jgi:predicted ATPase/DNA-binding SARP family transcriptional activator